MTELDRIVYVCSSGRSGSTLLDMMLGSHPEFMSLGEIEHLPKNVALNTTCACGEPVRSCPFWTQVFERIKTQHGIDILGDPYSFPIGLFRASRVIDHSRQTKPYLFKRKIILGAKYAEQAWGFQAMPSRLSRSYETGLDNSFKLYGLVAEVSGCSGVVDSSKEYRRAVSLYQRDPQRVRPVLLIRDGRAVFNAMLRSGAGREQSLNFWKRYYEHALVVIERNVAREHVHRLRYEELVGSPELATRALCDFLNVKHDPGMLRFRDRVKHVLNGNDMRNATTSEIRLDERWKRELAPDDLAYFVAQGGQTLNRRLGYD